MCKGSNCKDNNVKLVNLKKGDFEINCFVRKKKDIQTGLLVKLI